MDRRIHYHIVLQLQVVVNDVIVIGCGLSQLILEHRFVGGCQKCKLIQREVFEHAIALTALPEKTVH